MKLISKIATCALAFGTSVAFASPALAGTGSFIFKNNSSVTVSRIVDTFDSDVVKQLPNTISGKGGSASGRVRRSSNDVFGGTVTYEDPATGYGCHFTTVVIYREYYDNYLFTFEAAPTSSSPSTTTCTMLSSRNKVTGDFTAYPVISGF